MWRGPQADGAGERHATWLELFLDLIFVYALAAVTRRLGDDPTPSPSAVLAVLGLFVVVQWAWLGQVFYDTRFDPDDVPHRISPWRSSGTRCCSPDDSPRRPRTELAGAQAAAGSSAATCRFQSAFEERQPSSSMPRRQ
ncbi:low temperature requirement protein A [Micromonospora sp. NPDC049102]|uniref:low temperature requirement protein A n=1 Tax=Micromonospora sp. NPDC049102 TaxID=3364265 RepID=UPI003713110A